MNSTIVILIDRCDICILYWDYLLGTLLLIISQQITQVYFTKVLRSMFTLLSYTFYTTLMGHLLWRNCFPAWSSLVDISCIRFHNFVGNSNPCINLIWMDVEMAMIYLCFNLNIWTTLYHCWHGRWRGRRFVCTPLVKEI
jgi:hypothetical protein